MCGSDPQLGEQPDIVGGPRGGIGLSCYYYTTNTTTDSDYYYYY